MEPLNIYLCEELAATQTLVRELELRINMYEGLINNLENELAEERLSTQAWTMAWRRLLERFNEMRERWNNMRMANHSLESHIRAIEQPSPISSIISNSDSDMSNDSDMSLDE